MPGVHWFTHVHDMLSLRNVSTDKKEMAEPVNDLILWVYKSTTRIMQRKKKNLRSETPSCSSTIQILKRENAPQKIRLTDTSDKHIGQFLEAKKKKINTKDKLNKQKALL